MPTSAPDPHAPTVLTVSQLTEQIEGVLGATFGDVWVRGELGRVTYASSGHIYLDLKDEGAVLNAAVWRSNARRLPFRLEQGQEVVAQGSIDVYAPRGSYSLIVRRIEPVGTGALQIAFEQLRKRLSAEGLFEEERKRPLPFLPRRVALVTSRTGAAVRDLVTVMHRRLPSVHLILVPTRVQGDGAAEEVAAAIRFADAHARADVLVVGRGGGSLEDLWAFNEETVARAIHGCRTPVVSAVGHETDVSISDLVADVRAATPSQAGELVVPSADDLRARVDALAHRLERRLRTRLDQAWQRLEAWAERPVLRDPASRLRPLRAALDALGHRLSAVSPLAQLRGRAERVAALAPRLGPPLERRIAEARRRVDEAGLRAGTAIRRRLERELDGVRGLDLRLRALSPLAVLGRGYSLTRDVEGRVVRAASDVAVGDPLHTRLADGGEIDSRVERTRPPETNA